MCPPLSCCHGCSTGPLSTPLYHLVRLLLASSPELTDVEPTHLHAQQDALWDALQEALQVRYNVGQTQALELTERLLMSLLLEECCRQSLVQAVPLADALGFAWAVPVPC